MSSALSRGASSTLILKQLGSAFPEFAEALKKPLTDAGAQKATFGVLDILLNARAPSAEIKTAARHWSAFSDETGNSKPALEVFERLAHAEPTWIQAREARCRLLIHLNRPTQALRLIDSVEEALSPELTSLKGLCLMTADPAQAERLLESSKDYVNLAAIKASRGDENGARQAWEQAVIAIPKSMAALNGAKKFNEVLNMQWDDSKLESGKADFNARMAQAVTGLAIRAREELLVVTSEGLFRSAVSDLEKSCGQAKKPAYALELSRSLDEYAKLLKKWDKREKEAENLQVRAKELRERTSSLLPSFAFDVKGWTIADDPPSEQ